MRQVESTCPEAGQEDRIIPSARLRSRWGNSRRWQTLESQLYAKAACSNAREPSRWVNWQAAAYCCGQGGEDSFRGKDAAWLVGLWADSCAGCGQLERINQRTGTRGLLNHGQRMGTHLPSRRVAKGQLPSRQTAKGQLSIRRANKESMPCSMSWSFSRPVWHFAA